MDADWSDYYRKISGRPPRPLLAKALTVWGDRPAGAAVDLGCGDGTETLALLAGGWSVTAVDSSPASAELIRERADATHRPRLEIQTVAIEAATLTDIDLAYAGYSLPFVPPHAFPAVWSRIRASLRPGAVLAANLFGPNDTWATDTDMTFHDRSVVAGLLEGLEMLEFEETDEDGVAASGPKHWHFFEFVARRPGYTKRRGP